MRQHIRAVPCLCLLACLWALAACSIQPISSGDQVATRVAQDLAVAATLTAVARGQPTAIAIGDATATPTPAAVVVPTEPPPQSTDTPLPQPTEPPPQPTDIPVPPTAPPEPTEPPIAYSDVNFSGNPVPGDEVGGKIQIAGAELNENQALVVRSFLSIRVFARFPDSATQDGAGVDNVQIAIGNDQTGDLVQQRIERTAGYCAFGGGEPDCVPWVFAEQNNQWPNGQPIADGSYTVNISITKLGDSEPSVFWNFQFEVAQS